MIVMFEPCLIEMIEMGLTTYEQNNVYDQI